MKASGIRHRLFAGTVASIFLLATPAIAAPVHLNFSHFENDRALRFDSLSYPNEAGEQYSSTRLSYLISGISFASAEGKPPTVLDTVGFIDAVRSRTRVTLPDVAPGRYGSISFHVGVDRTRNHADPAKFTANHPLNPNLNNLHWDWEGGYIFMALEGHWRRPGAANPEGYAYHFATDANRTLITLPGRIEIKQETEILIGLDLSRTLRGLSFEQDGATTHSHPGDPVARRIRTNLPASFQLIQVNSGPSMPPQQKLKPIDLPAKATPHPVRLPKHVPIPVLPLDNPLITERVALGKALFHDPILSRNGTISCSSCHQADKALTDSRRFSPGVDGKHGNRHSMPLFNLAWKESFFWDGRAPSLRTQALMPIEDHLEMDSDLEGVVDRLSEHPDYPALFAAAFGSGHITPDNLGLAIENFLLTQLSFDSKFDRAMKGKVELSEKEKRGFELFFTESEPRLKQFGADCFHCHGGALFSDHQFHNTGLPGDDPGLFKTSGKESDRKKFSTPSLRNVAVTAPYMHDGRFATLEEVIDHYNSGFERSPTLDPNLAKHPNGLGLSDEDKQALVAFLKTLTDSAYASGP